ncbi:unnamed protein product [Trichobilharzia regenti]|nr:unnamed protein product [Trichobilharzia regenti]
MTKSGFSKLSKMHAIIVFLLILLVLPTGTNETQERREEEKQQQVVEKTPQQHDGISGTPDTSLINRYQKHVQPEMVNVSFDESEEMKNATKDVINLITGHNEGGIEDSQEEGEEDDIEETDELKENM